MNKAELIVAVANKTGIEQADVRAVIEATMTTVSDELLNGGEVTLRTFGTFTTKTRAQKTARNIGEGTPIVVPEHKIPYWKPSGYISVPLKAKTSK